MEEKEEQISQAIILGIGTRRLFRMVDYDVIRFSMLINHLIDQATVVDVAEAFKTLKWE